MTQSAQRCERCGRPLSERPANSVCTQCLNDLGRVSWLVNGQNDPFQTAATPSPDDPIVSWPSESELIDEGDIRFEDYELVEKIGQGGMGVVYKARQLSTEGWVAIKMIRKGELASAMELRRFRTEAETAASLDHPNIVPIYDVGEFHGCPYFSMPLMEGGNLRQRLKEFSMPAAIQNCDEGTSRLNPSWLRERQRTIAHLMEMVARTVHFAHQRGVLHRDLKPSNILLDAKGQAYVTDFGLARWIEKDSSLTRSGDVLGTPSYMSPERALGREGYVAGDVYSLGAILYTLLAGYPPFLAATPLETMRQVIEQHPVSPRKLNPEVDRDLDVICLKCLEKDPSERYLSAEEFAGELGRWLKGRPISTRPASAWHLALRWARKNPWLATSASVLCFLFASTIILLAVMVDERRRKEETQAQWLMKVNEELERLWKDPAKNYAIIDAETRALIAGAHLPPPRNSTAPLRLDFAVYTHQEPVIMRNKFIGLIGFLENAMSHRLNLAVRINLHIFKGYSNAVHALIDGEVDLMRLGAVSYVLAREMEPELQLLLVQKNENLGYIFTRKDLPIDRLDGLRLRSFAFGDPDSTLSSLLPKVKLYDAGITRPDLSSSTYLGSHDSVVEAVLTGKLDAGAVNANALTNQARALNLIDHVKVLDIMRAASMAWVGKSTTNTHDLMAFDAFKGSLLSLHQTHLLDQISKGLTGFAEKSDSYYDETRVIIQKAALFDAP